MSDVPKRTEEKERICPSCRMSISVLATKCRYCGEEVGRPKEEARQLTISDLGGEEVHHRAASGSVLDALESFRVEEQSATQDDDEDTDSNAVIGRRRQSAQTDVSRSSNVESLPALDDANRDILSLSLQKDSSTGGTRSKLQTPKQRAIKTAKLVLGISVLVFVGIKGFAWGREYIDIRNAVPVEVYVNQAPRILRQGGSPMAALAAAVDALSREDNSENRKIAEDSVNAVVDQVTKLLNAKKWSLDKLNKASGIASGALSLYPSEATMHLDGQVKMDNTAYKMVLISVDTSAQTATFALNKANRKPVTVKKGETIEDRFVLRSFVGRNRVRVEDKMRRGRYVTFGIGELPQ